MNKETQYRKLILISGKWKITKSMIK